MKNLFELTIIGKFNDEKTLKLNSEFYSGLKHLDGFSHMIIIYSENEKLKQKILKIESTDIKTGTVITGGINNKNTNVYDIKPYFPSEDNALDIKEDNFFTDEISDINGKNIFQSGYITRENGKYVIKPENTDFAEKIKNFSHIKIFWWFDRFDKSKYRKTVLCNPPYENAPQTGVFASRSPVRPTPIALTTAKILKTENGKIYVSELECFENTPLIGLIPYTASDSVPDAIIPKWLSHWRKSIEETSYGDGTLKIKNTPAEHILSGNNSKKRFPEIKVKKITEKTGLKITGARHNNLKSVNTTIPYGTLTSVTGVSGSGKSSFAFDTVYSECRKRFLDASGENAYEGNSDFDSMEGIIPAIAISQSAPGQNVYSTVGTSTGITNQLRIIFSSVGIRHCPSCGTPVIPLTEDTIENILSEMENYVIKDINNNTHNNFRDALKIGNGVFSVITEKGEKLTMQTHTSCPECGKILFDISPSLFSYTNPESMCPVCHGKGEIYDVDTESIVERPDLSLLDGAAKIWGKLSVFIKNPNHNWIRGQIVALANEMNVDLSKPWKDLPEDFKKQAIYGSEGRNVSLTFTNNKSGRNGNITKPVEGAYNVIKRLISDEKASQYTIGYLKKIKCSHCNGERLNEEGRSVTINGIRYPEVLSMSLKDLKIWCEKLYSEIPEYQFQFISPVLKKIIYDLNTCKELGIDYLSLSRGVSTLSGGELQRLKLVSQFGSDISGVLYVMDEPTAGLHPRDYEKLINIIKNLKQNSNTVLLVEHNKTLIRNSDRIIDIGPGAGDGGGEIVADGKLEDVIKNGNSETLKYIRGEKTLSIPKNSHKSLKFIEFENIHYNNLKNISVKIPLKSITCITGVSGSGKSSLMEGVLFPTFEKNREINCTYTKKADFKQIILADQSPIGRTPRSVPATYTGIMDEIRNIFAAESGKDPGYFSFNSAEGQCDNCKGGGEIKIEFIDTWVRCPVCEGKRYKKNILDIKLNGKNIYDVLRMSINEAADYFRGKEKISKTLSILNDVGLGYLRLGQNSATLSGGEAQRLKLAKNLCRSSGKNDLYLLDEPTTGLHFSDIQNLLMLFRKLTESGSTVILVEHNPDVIKNSDWVIDLGPESGDSGGEIVAQGTPFEISNVQKSYTGQYIK